MKTFRLSFLSFLGLMMLGVNYAQEFYVSNGFELRKVTIGGTGCTSVVLPVCQGLNPATIALYQDSLYSIAGSQLKRSIITNGTVTSCTVIGQALSSINAMTADSTGMLYAAAGSALYKINPRTGTSLFLGTMSFASAGDLLFYKGKLYMAALTPARGIVKVNIDTPARSAMYIPIPQASIFGLVNVAISCNENRVYATSIVSGGTDVIELNMDLATTLGAVCRLPFGVGDAASSTETGLFAGVNIQNIKIVPECSNKPASASIEVNTYPGLSAFTYQLNTTITNTTGLFTGLTPGNYAIHISAAGGCMRDTTVTVPAADTPHLQTQITNAICNTSGSISSMASSGVPPYRYSLNNGLQQASGNFSNITQGNYLLQVADSNQCISKQEIRVNQINPPLTQTISTVAPFCNETNGVISVTTPGNIAGYSINNGTQQSTGQFNTLAAGSYTVSTFTAQGCRYDSSITLQNINHPTPAITINATAPDCFNRNNGSLNMSINGLFSPYQVSLNSSPYTNQLAFNSLSSGAYPIKIRDAGGCVTDTSATIPLFISYKPAYTFLKEDPTCAQLRGGFIRFNISENQANYRIWHENTTYANDYFFRNLTEGQYFFKIWDRNNCPADSVSIRLNLLRAGKCDTVYVPTAFTPDRNGNNDIFRGTVYGEMKTYSFALYNRYGQLLFASKNDLEGWNGTYKGTMQPAGAYIWMLSYTPVDGRKRNLKGSFILIR